MHIIEIIRYKLLLLFIVHFEIKNTAIEHNIIANATSKLCNMKLNCSVNNGAVINIIGKTQFINDFLFFSKEK